MTITDNNPIFRAGCASLITPRNHHDSRGVLQRSKWMSNTLRHCLELRLHNPPVHLGYLCPNIPSPHKLWPKLAARRFRLMLDVLIMPEIIVTLAVQQRSLAHTLADKYKENGAVEGCNYPPMLVDSRVRLDPNSQVFLLNGRLHGM
jgi:hypothetical protein